MTDQFLVGDLYFRVKYAEHLLKYPQLDSFVFVGKNLSKDDLEDTWYFQFADSYAKHGSIAGSSGADRRVLCLNKNQLADMLNDQQLLSELAAARGRRKSGNIESSAFWRTACLTFTIRSISSSDTESSRRS